MPNLFDYTHFEVSLERQTKNCTVTIQSESNTLDSQIFVHELERLFSWLSNKLEISSVLIEFNGQMKLLNDSFIRDTAPNNFIDLCHKVQELTWIQLLLPQTIIWDMGDISDYHMWELSYGGDIRLCDDEAVLHTNILEKGLCPLFSGPSMLNKMFNFSKIKAHINCGLELSANELLETGIAHFKNSFGLRKSLVTKIAKQSSVTRIQNKRSMNNELIEDMQDMMNKDREFAHASLVTGDWKNFVNKRDFVNPRELGKILKENKAAYEESEISA